MLQREQLAEPLPGKIQQRIKLRARERPRLAGALHLHVIARLQHHHVGIHLGVTILEIGEVESRFADNRITTSGRSEDVSITATVWVKQRRGAATGNDTSPGALKQLADEAVQIARISPVHREYVPTLGPLEYPEERGFAESTANIDLDARAKVLAAVLEACRAAKVTGAGFHTARASATATATANGNRRFFRSSEGNFSLTARSADGTGSGYYAGDHFDLSRLDARTIVEEAVRKAVRSQNPRPIDPGTYPVILEPQAVSDLIGSLTNAFDARTADEGRSAFSARSGKTRLGEQLFDRSSKGGTLTDAGRVLQNYGQRLVRLAEETESSMRELRDLRRGRVLIGANEAAVHTLLPLMARFRQRVPHIALDVRRVPARQIAVEVQQGSLDFEALTFRPAETGLLEVVVGSTPGWSEPWSRARLARVERDPDGWRHWLVGDDGLVIDESAVQHARLSVWMH